ncbi:MAG: DNA-processing protein DprA [Duncaniella sp.]|nr:DNA-processing protein DprA [Duncaniella sp.]
MTTLPALTYRIAFASLRGINPTIGAEILARVGTEENFFTFSADQLTACIGFRNKLYDKTTRDKALALAREETEFVERSHIRPIYFRDKDYPARLLECTDAPLMLYTLGDCDLNGPRFISIVGTRHATAYGTAFVEDLVSSLAKECADRLVIVSGLAYGIDVAAHKAALNASLPTVGVLAHGLNTIYPAVHRDIAARMVRQGGMLLTEYRSGAQIHKGNFLLRNRIVAGLSDCTLVVESDSHGGAMVTARLALAYSRDVFALPGRVSDRYSRGCNSLINSCVAHLVTCPDDIIDTMGWPRRPAEGDQQELFSDEQPPLTPQEQTVIDTITRRGDATFQELSVHLAIPTPRLMGLLIDMELRSLILSLPGGRYRLR